ncbi:uncharacterized protein A1O5_09072 [Cladophialophora psammophila CBS 110553]|uniref:Transcription elongation factor Eaf N-terminal domain-containing protein n=1 Tax=Cladophialophora psammophila CBS 110553 TaxID=1182543 RepID=W9WSU0_9EURO|nr:uncharacterized protein A1O5_09072 [Cladophialophora psammophila CBS 110553]EXJ67726.1 hypothetical protein A1O5_09072 [Cladophialophora psammophila CBS 110553]
MASPAIHPSKPSGLVDPRQSGDYPIILGESLKADAKAQDLFLNIRYNWQPKSGFGARESRLRKAGDRYHLEVSDSDSAEYEYLSSKSRSEPSGTPDDQSRSLALIFDQSKSAFVLEAISTSLDMNLKAAPGMSSKDARALPQLPGHLQSSTKQPEANGHAAPSSDDETPDPSNPYDFRHFLAEARETLEKSTNVPGNRTPIPGSRTPMSGTTTPAPGGSRFLPTTPQSRPTSIPATSRATQQRKKKSEDVSRGPGRAPAAKAPTKRDMPKPTQPLSKARVFDSDEDDESSDVTRAAAPKSASTTARPSQPKAGKGHTRNVSDNIGSSPHIIINDDDGDLEIDMGSPPPDNGRSRRGRVDPEMFRSHTATPIGGLSSNIGRSTSRPVSKPPVEEIARGRPGRERDRGRDTDRDVTMKDIEGASSGGEDEDVEEFELGSPREKSIVVPNRGDVSRSQDDVSEDEDRRDRGRRPQQQQQIDQAPPTPPEPVNSHDDDDEDLLEAALEAALEEEDENEDRGIGLGIGMAHGNMQDDESEVSEEE